MTDTTSRVIGKTQVQGTDARRFPWTILLVCVIVMLPVLAFPFGQDHSTFIRGGRAILGGGTLYVDFIDVKPPLIYILYGIADLLSGGSTVVIRAFEVLYQTLTIGVLLVVLRGVTHSESGGGLPAIAYALLYATLGYSQSGQPEALCALLIIGSLWCAMQESGRRRWIVLTLCMAAAFLLKYTLAVIGPAAMLVWLLRDGTRLSIRPISLSFLLAFAIVTLVALPFVLSDGFVHGWRTTMQYLEIYAAYPPLGIPFVTSALKLIGTYFGDHVSLLFTLLAIGGAMSLLGTRLSAYDPTEEHHATKKASAFVSTTLVMFLVLAATVVLERKFSPYHFSRIFIPLTFLIGAGATMWPTLRTSFRAAPTVVRFSIGTLAIMFLALSPLPRYVNVVQLALRSIGNPQVYDAYLTRIEMPGFNFTDIRTLKNDLSARMQQRGPLMLMSMMATPILVDVSRTHASSFADSHLYFGVGAAPEWRALAAKEMREAGLVVVDTNDICEGVNLHERTSWQSLQQDSTMMPILTSQFVAVDTVACFIIFERATW